jgi:flagellar biosynthesis protein FlhG
MNDQAEKLRRIIDNLNGSRQFCDPAPFSTPKIRSTRIIAITSGKGGVGKTNITVNLAIALSELGRRVIIIDADLGLANIDVLFGIIPKFTLADVINNKRNILEVLSDGPNKIKFISGGSGVEELVKLGKVQLENFVNNISLLDRLSDFILIDTGAGLSDNVMSFVMAADEVLLITTPEPTSLTDAYALIKMVSNRNSKKEIKLIVNRAEDQMEAQDIMRKLSIVSEKFLSMKLNPLGYILNDEMVIKAVKKQQPFSLSFPKSRASRYIREISKKLIELNDININDEKGIKNFVNRLVNFLSA